MKDTGKAMQLKKKSMFGICCYMKGLFLYVGLANRFEEYPKQRELIRLKDELITSTNAPPM